jgi:hypothetical protein
VTLGLLKSLSAYALRHRISLRVDLRASGSGPVTVTEVINDILLSTRFPYCTVDAIGFSKSDWLIHSAARERNGV